MAGKYHAPQQQRGRAGTYIKGYKKVPTYEDILGQELRNQPQIGSRLMAVMPGPLVASQPAPRSDLAHHMNHGE